MAEAAEVAPAAPAPKLVTTPFERGAGTALGTAAIFAAVWLLRRERRNAALGRSAWRTPNALLLAVVGATIVWGSWIDPAAEPKRFVLVWCCAVLGIAFAASVAGVDLLVIRRRGLAERRALNERGRAELLANLPSRGSMLEAWRKASDN